MSDLVTRCRRRDGDGVCEVRVSVRPDLERVISAAGFVEDHGEWVRRFPADAPHLERAWTNLQRLLEPWLAQAAGLEPVPWPATLAEVSRRLDEADIDWFLTGSAALAVRGIPIEPHDLDLVVAGDDAHRVGDILLDGLVEPVAPEHTGWQWWGRAVLGARVEWAGGVRPSVDRPEPTDFGPTAAAALEPVEWAGRILRVPPLSLQRAVSARRGLHDRVALIDATAPTRPR